MSALDFYEEAFYMPLASEKVTSPLRFRARYMAGRSREEAFTSNGSPEQMVAALLPAQPWAVPGRGVDGSAH